LIGDYRSYWWREYHTGYNPASDDTEKFTVTIGDSDYDMRSGMTRGVYEALNVVGGVDDYSRKDHGVGATVITGEKTPRNGYWIGSRGGQYTPYSVEQLASYAFARDFPNMSLRFRPAVVLEGLAAIATEAAVA
jgi:hypothetical protein